jgi:putative flippase GtrA
VSDAQPGAAAVETPVQRPRPIRLVLTLLNDRRMRYLIVGGISAVVYYVIFSVGWLVSARHIPYLAMAAIANVLNAVVMYPLYRKGVFQSTGPIIPGFLKFYVICFWSLLYTMVGLPLLVEVAHVPVLIAQAILIVTAPLINYQFNKYWAFRR